jgi:hypothetical protein
MSNFWVDHNMKSEEFKTKYKWVIWKRNDLIHKEKKVEWYLTEKRLW